MRVTLTNSVSPMACRWLRLLLVASTQWSCSGNPGVYQEESPTVEKSEEPKSETDRPKPLPFTLARKIRRITLDLATRLPLAEDYALVNQTASQLNLLVAELLHTTELANTVADWHRQSWRLRTDELPDLDRFVAAGNVTLASALSQELREAIISEPLNLISYIMQTGQPYSSIFLAEQAVTTEVLTSLWGYQSEYLLGLDGRRMVASYSDSRPALGVLSNNGLLAALDSEGRGTNETRMASILSRMACTNLQSSRAHLFTEFTDDEMDGDLRQLAYSHKSCSGCHRQFTDAAGALFGLGTGANFSSWTTYSNSGSQPTGTYRGHTFSDHGKFAQLVATDSRILRCTLIGIHQQILQRGFQKSDSGILHNSMSAMIYDDYQLTSSLQSLLSSQQYLQGPLLGGKTLTERLKTRNGIRVLTRRMWQGVASQLLPGQSWSFSEHLDPGFSDMSPDQRYDPTSSYWHAAESAARSIASALIGRELSNESSASDRLLLSLLPDGSGVTTDDKIINKQIIAIWKFLTTYELNTGTSIFLRLRELFDQVNTANDVATVRTAWQTLIIAIMLHEAFVTY